MSTPADVRVATHVTPLYFDEASNIGGGERYPANLARGIVAASDGHWRVRIVSFGRSSASRQLSRGVTLEVLRVSHVPRTPLDPMSWDILDRVRDSSVVHVHQEATRTSESALLAAAFVGRPLVVTDHGGPTSSLIREMGATAHVDAWLCQSEFARARTPRGARTVLAPGGVDVEAFRPAARRVARDTVLFVGRLLPHKGVDRLVAAAPHDISVTLCGRPYDERYRALLGRLAEGKRVEIVTGADDAQLRALYQRAWLTVLPSVHLDIYGNAHPAPELMGLVVLESMACGTPVAVARTAALPEFVRHGETGFVFDSIDELGSILEHVRSSPEVVARMGAAARAAAEEMDCVAVGRDAVGLYEELLAERH